VAPGTGQPLDAAATAAALPWAALVDALARTLADERAGHVQAPARWVLPVAPATQWFVMPAWTTADAGDLAAIKLITYSAGNAARGLPAILGDVLVLRASTGQRLAILDGPTVTARRTAAVSLLAAQQLAPVPGGPLLLIGTGVQALSHAQALAAGLGVREVWVRGRTAARAAEFAALLRAQGLAAQPVADGDAALDAALARCPLVVTATPAAAPCLDRPLRDDVFVAAVGAFTPAMIELAPPLTRSLAARGQVVIDSAAARHEAGDLLGAGLPVADLPTLGDWLAEARPRPAGPVLFKSCGAALWDLAAARCAVGC
jgi:ornithine cyclodeaminase